MPGPNSTSVRSANDLNPWTRSPSRRAGAVTSRLRRGVRRLVGRQRILGAGRVAASASAAVRRPPRRRLRARDAARSWRSTSSACGGGRRLRDPARRALADAERPPVDLDLDPELLLVVGSDGLDQPVERPLAGRPLGVLLEPALGALERRDRVVGGQLLRGQLVDPVARGVPAEVQVDRPDEGLERATPAATAGRGRRAAPRPRRAAGTSRGRAGSPSRARPGRAHDRGAAGGQHALVVGRVAPVQRLGDGEADDGVAQELEPLVVAGRGVGMLVQPAAVDERLGQQVAVAGREARGAPPGRRPGASRPRSRRSRTSARRCSRRRPGRSGSSRRPRRRSRSRTPLRGS